MVRRLVLGCGGAGTTLVEQIATRRGSLKVIVETPRRAESLREESIDAVEADPTDPASYPGTADVVLVFGDDAARNLAAVDAATESFPDALVVAYTGSDASDAERRAIAAAADRVVDPVEATVERVRAVSVGGLSERLRKLLRVLKGIDGPLAVVTHDNPDPDAIGAAFALSHIAESVGVSAQPVYFGDISHQENRALVNLLDLDLRNLPDGHDMSEFGGIALVDHSRPGVNDGLDPETSVDVVVDHHPPRAPVEASYVHLRHQVGATSTILADYLERLGLDPSRTVATALLFGLQVDTNDFVREVSVADFEAAAYLLPFADGDLLDRVESPSMSGEVFDTLARAITNREVRGSVLASCVGRITDRDALAQAADGLLDMEGVRVTLVYGHMDGTVYASGRARGAEIDLGEAFRDAFDPLGSAGGHADMAGAQLSLGLLGDVGSDSNESLSTIIADVITRHFFETLETAPGVPSMEGTKSDLAYEVPLDE